MLSRASIDYCLLTMGTFLTGPSQQKILEFYEAPAVTSLIATICKMNNTLSGPSLQHNTLIRVPSDSNIIPDNVKQYIQVELTKQPGHSARKVIHITDTIQFRDTWVKPFTLIGTEPFISFDRTKTKVPMMSNTGIYQYYKEGMIEAIVLHFQSGAYIELVKGLPAAKEFLGIIKYETCNIRVTVPKFSLSSKRDLRQILVDNGLGELYDTSRSISIEQAEQEIMFDFNEVGAEARIKTVFVTSLNCAPRVVTFDRAFHFRLIKDSLVILTGTYDGT
jgi:serine protease inhibitor